MKDKPLPKSLREKKRYIAFQAYGQGIDQKAIGKAIYTSAGRLLGRLEMAKAGISIITFDEKTKKGILRVSTKYADHAKASLLFIQSIDDQETIVHSLVSSGMLKKAKAVLV
ncbi:ribonuclease P protein component 2 [Candidatus Woesearchaeota archaeon]|nr:MAG: ribonuclease P/MRP protein subunit POP5 [archaeon GW2011_AR4]MBS3130662.1 ribonuclease P protein component 2 [Candidatus Woesearchaeota archaeon]HIH37943.1 ribonuclease P protein component 2 [Candidatus Woesearchaeota archaeon]HIH48635.1 ribonuclease P protein component 2 [Candidatus Woesearchaeota archaeon]HIJ03722.1 ribonuclease P protein component 2 [Candidatus Woesearchaeota archaeon]